MKFILGTKLGMSQVFNDQGKVIPVTLIEAGPVVVTQLKTKEKDGYESVQFGFGKKSKNKLTKPIAGHLKDLGSFRWLREYGPGEVKDGGDLKVGDKLDVSVFEIGEKVVLRGTSKGKGFQGVVKRHGFAGLPKPHGTKKKHRAAGSIGSMFPQHVRKGKRMAGRMGQDQVTRRNIEIVRIDKENNLIAIKGAGPGARGSLGELGG